MAQETKIGMKLDEKTKGIKRMCEQLGDSIKHEFDKGIEHIKVEEMKEAIDMLKDLYEIKKSMVEACYYKQLMEAMEESEYGEDYDEEGPLDDGRRGYRGQPRDSMGRFTSRGNRRGRSSKGGRRGRMGYEDMMPEYDEDIWDRDMDMMRGMMYYSGQGESQGGNMSRSGSNRSSQGSGVANTGDTSSSRYGYTHDAYMKEKQVHPGQSEQEKKMRMHKLNEHLEDLEEMAKETISGMSPEEKQAWRVKLNKIINM